MDSPVTEIASYTIHVTDWRLWKTYQVPKSRAGSTGRCNTIVAYEEGAIASAARDLLFSAVAQVFRLEAILRRYANLA